MFAYPQSFPVDEAVTLAALLRGRPVNTTEDMRCAWAVAGYGLSVAMPTTPAGGFVDPNLPHGGAAPAHSPLGRTQAAEALERLCQEKDRTKLRAAVGSVPWQQIISTILALLQQYLNK